MGLTDFIPLLTHKLKSPFAKFYKDDFSFKNRHLSLYVEMDLHKNYLQVAVINEKGKVMRNSKCVVFQILIDCQDKNSIPSSQESQRSENI
jgi:hypothetical protein